MLKAQKHVDLARFQLGGKFISDKKKFFETEQDWNHFSNLVNRFALITLRELRYRSPLRSGFVKKELAKSWMAKSFFSSGRVECSRSR
jgi:hypothetical protein